MEELSEAKTSRGRVTMRTLLRLRMLFGFYSAVSRRAALRVLARLYCLCIAYAMTTVLITTAIENNVPYYFVLPALTQYILNVFISLLTGDNHYFNFCKVIECADNEMGLPYLQFISSRIKIIFLIICAMYILDGALFVSMFLSIGIDLTGFIIKVILSGGYLNCLMNTFQLDLLRSRLVNLRHVFKNVNRRGRDVNQQIKTIYDCLNLYKTMIDKFNATYIWPKVQISARLIGVFVAFLAYGRVAIWQLKNDTDNKLEPGLVIYGLLVENVIAGLPAMFAELVIREVDRLKLTVGNLILECEEDEVRAELELAAVYLELRSFRVSILRVVTLDGSFVLAFAGLATTSLIVLIQISGVI